MLVHWLRKEEKSHKGPSGSGIKRWDSVRCAANLLTEDELIAAQGHVIGSEKP